MSNYVKTWDDTFNMLFRDFQVVCYGLSLPLAEHDTIKDCVNIYCEWLSALLPVPKPCVPTPIAEEPNRYSRKIIAHLYHLFVPRKGEGNLDGKNENKKMLETRNLFFQTWIIIPLSA